MKIAVIYFTKTDVTGKLAQEVIKGICGAEPNAVVLEHRIDGKEIVEGRFINPTLFESLLECDAIIMGSPTYMGGVSAQFKAFADASSEFWSEQMWSSKVAAGFTSGSAPNGDQSSTLNYLVTLANQHGMYWVGLDLAHGYKDQGLNRFGCQLGVVSQSVDGVADEVDLLSAKYLGQRVVGLVSKLKPKT
ncbi:flavodoxin family protein [Vibrio metschnikovii]|uniref:flavodoxin family protein n=1 Tax=Vibrio TaxID=662 RepID=UPI0001540404|nr:MULTISPECIES: flavodoxin family protein [Vibrio]EHZ2848893.1 flavodoxin family protein [Vibrio vulnificus]EKO3619037.1 flavodoxin family protein [Vibrio metschnikovii]EGQ8204452.1 flavodoxin family protein [Vibrio cholerae]EGR0597738.1 flavodoxin family protein [Vibrio cholerae]EGR1049482.1 flavodoxin family protein [Vibrio cholerae]